MSEQRPPIVDDYERITIPEPIALFRDAVVIESDGSIVLRVPDRILTTPLHGRWKFRVSGQRKWQKEYDDFGAIRFTQSGRSFWVPHVYPFEEIDTETRLPLIKERERLKIKVLLEKFQESRLEDPYPVNAILSTSEGTFVGQPDAGMYYGSGGEYYDFTEWDHLGQPNRLQIVDYEEPNSNIPSTTEQLVARLATGMSMEEAMDDDGYVSPYAKPNHHSERAWETWGGDGFGEIYVPISVLRDPTTQAIVTFPCFEELSDSSSVRNSIS